MRTILCFDLLFLVSLISIAAVGQNTVRPNVLILLTNDLGHGDLSHAGRKSVLLISTRFFFSVSISIISRRVAPAVPNLK